ncbi:MAG: hypothetical protein ACI8VT_003155 [Saprospiraceae bacterium]|jgi:uncharacterized protein YjiK
MKYLKKRKSASSGWLFCLVTCLSLPFSISCTEQKSEPKTPPIEAMPASVATPLAEIISNTETEEEDKRFKFKYDLDNPGFTYTLPQELLEISALTYDDQRKTLLAVNDERANIYLLDAKDCSVKEEYDFGKKGDYEGIEIVGDIVYVVKSNGNIFSFNLDSKTTGEEYKTPLSETNDIEGLGYDKKNNELILACKAAPNLEKQPKLKKTKAFYAFNLDKKKLSETPKFVIEDKSLEAFFDKEAPSDESKKAKKKLRERLKSFSPSAIARHPQEGYYYILSSVGKLLIVCSKKGKVKSIRFLDDDLFSQPEGICFAPDGTLFISNEGRSLVAKILTFDYKL